MTLLSSLNPVRRFERRYAEYLISRFQIVPFPGGARLNLIREMAPIRGLQEKLAAVVGKPLLLVGEPGAGKTTALARMAIAHARALAAGDPTAHVPILIPTRELASKKFPCVADLSHVLLGSVLAAQCPPGYFGNAISAGVAVVLVDDLDVLPGDAVSALLEEFGNARIIASATTALPGLTAFPLPGWRDDDIRLLARNSKVIKAPAFLASLSANAIPRALTSNPMMLALLMRVWHPEQPLPNRRTALFDAFADTVLRDEAQITHVLEQAGLNALKDQVTPNGITAQSRGFMRIGRNHTAEFAHDLWASYFAARALRRAGDQTMLVESLADPRWQEALVFFAGWGDATELSGNLIARGEWHLAGRVLANAEQARADLRATVIRELIRLAWQGDARATAVLAEMNSEAALDEFGARLKDQDDSVRLRAVELIGQLRLDRGVDYLLPQLRDPSPKLRGKIVQALGLARTDRVVDPLLVALRGDGRPERSDIALRAAAARALGATGSDRAVPALIVDMQLGDPELRVAAVQALKQMTSPLMVEPLRSIAASGDDQARRDAAEILATNATLIG